MAEYSASLTGPSGFEEATITSLSVQSGLHPGLTTFTLKYRAATGPPLVSASFSRRNITVFAL